MQLASLQNALNFDGIEINIIKSLFERWMLNLRRLKRFKFRVYSITGVATFTYHDLFSSFLSSFRKEDILCSKRAVSPTRMALPPWSLKTDKCLERWFDPDLVPQADPSTSRTDTEMLRIEEAFAAGTGLLPGATVGAPGEPLWLTSDISHTERSLGAADSLRDALGLFEVHSNEYAFLVQLGPNVASLGIVRAPTVMDAKGYARFRSWPPGPMAADADLGRTYDLDGERRAMAVGGAYGRQELVSAARPLWACEQISRLGHVQTNTDRSSEAHEMFAEEISPGGSVKSLLSSIERRLG